MLMNLAFAALAMLAGVAVTCQGATNQSLLKVTGIGPTLLLNSLIALVGVTCLWFATGAPTTFFPARTAWTQYLGGVFGFILMVAIVLVFPRLGAAYAIALMVCGECVAAMIIDHYGLMAMAKHPATLQRVIGVFLVVAGVAVFQLSRSVASTP